MPIDDEKGYKTVLAGISGDLGLKEGFWLELRAYISSPMCDISEGQWGEGLKSWGRNTVITVNFYLNI